MNSMLQQQQQQQYQQLKSHIWTLLLASALVLPQLPLTAAYTRPDDFQRQVAFRDAISSRSRNWAGALASWRCPTDPYNSVGECDPCGQGFDGNWAHMHCRGNSVGWGESSDGTVDGVVTNMHITDLELDGPVPKELCVFPNLREFDLDGGHLNGPVPMWLHECFPKLEELDLSFNRLTGTLPEYLAEMPLLTEVKFEGNLLIGTIPPAFGRAKLRRFQVERNIMSGTIPSTFRNVTQFITQLHLANNDFEGDLSAVANSSLTTVTVHNNPKLCGMVPASVRYAKDYNPTNTRLGQPC